MTYPIPEDQSPQAVPAAEMPVGQPPAEMPVGQPPGVPLPAAPLAVRRQLAGVAMLVSAGLAVGGSLLPYAYTGYSSAGGASAFTVVTNLWRISYTGLDTKVPPEPGHSYIPGIPLMVAVALAVLAGIALLRPARYPGQGPRLWATAVGSVLAALTATDCLVAEATHSRKGLFLSTLLTERYGAGTWLLLAAGLVAVGGVVVAVLADRPWSASPAGSAESVAPADPAGPIVYAIPDADEQRTPPQGFPAQPEPEART